MYGLAIRFVVRMRKRVVGSEGETTPKSGGKRLRRSSPNEGAQKDWAMISVDSPDRTPNNQPALEGTLNEASASLKKGILTGGPPNVDEIREKAPSRVDAAPMLLPRACRYRA